MSQSTRSLRGLGTALALTAAYATTAAPAASAQATGQRIDV